ncbi:MAG: LLM class flavin-dependent oxidoreductase [Alphaproteobacteria bacterium]|nr:LLM class flavin-dependent oxidoreductase [Alphaproteobacteria bacterium]
MNKIGFGFLDRPSVREQLRLAQKAEALGYDSLWVTETRLARDAFSVLGAMAATTERIRLGTGIVNSWTRGPALMAVTVATLDNLAPGRINLGLGAYWDPLAWKQGIDRRKPLTQMREYVGVLRRLLALESGVTFEGELVRVRDLTLDLGYGDARVPPAVKLHIGPTGPKMMALAGEIADGVLINGILPPAYTRTSLDHIAQGAAGAGRRLADIEKLQLVNVSMNADAERAFFDAKRLVTQYLGQQPHFAKALAYPDDKLAAVKAVMGGWPPRPGGVEAAMGLVDDALVDDLIAHGTPEQCVRSAQRWLDAGLDQIVLIPLSRNYDDILEVFAPKEARP